MRRLILLPLALIFLLPLPAQAEDLPGPIRQIIDEARAQCEPANGSFSFNPATILEADFNRDNAPDYVVSATAFICSGSNDIYNTPAGHPHYLFLSSGPNVLRLDRSTSPHAYSARIENTTPPQLVYTQPCASTLGAAATQSRWGWSGTAMALISSTPPCPR